MPCPALPKQIKGIPFQEHTTVCLTITFRYTFTVQHIHHQYIITINSFRISLNSKAHNMHFCHENLHNFGHSTYHTSDSLS